MLTSQSTKSILTVCGTQHNRLLARLRVLYSIDQEKGRIRFILCVVHVVITYWKAWMFGRAYVTNLHQGHYGILPDGLLDWLVFENDRATNQDGCHFRFSNQDPRPCKEQGFRCPGAGEHAVSRVFACRNQLS
jgi:hypothetical protein